MLDVDSRQKVVAVGSRLFNKKARLPKYKQSIKTIKEQYE
jgi:hypothetical protein